MEDLGVRLWPGDPLRPRAGAELDVTHARVASPLFRILSHDSRFRWPSRASRAQLACASAAHTSIRAHTLSPTGCFLPTQGLASAAPRQGRRRASLGAHGPERTAALIHRAIGDSASARIAHAHRGAVGQTDRALGPRARGRGGVARSGAADALPPARPCGILTAGRAGCVRASHARDTSDRPQCGCGNRASENSCSTAASAQRREECQRDEGVEPPLCSVMAFRAQAPARGRGRRHVTEPPARGRGVGGT